jgi:hypothetical protein
MGDPPLELAGTLLQLLIPDFRSDLLLCGVCVLVPTMLVNTGFLAKGEAGRRPVATARSGLFCNS